jgi:hypothetical protein
MIKKGVLHNQGQDVQKQRSTTSSLMVLARGIVKLIHTHKPDFFSEVIRKVEKKR